MAGADGTVVRVQRNGQITLPAEIRRRLGLKKGDQVVLRETAEGILISSDGVGETPTEPGASAGARRDSDGFGRREYTGEQIEEFLSEDALTPEQEAIANDFLRDLRRR